MLRPVTFVATAVLVLVACDDSVLPTAVDPEFRYSRSRAGFTVNTADDVDDGVCDRSHCSLREAINAANAKSGSDRIVFAIRGSGVHTIQPLSGLPVITDPVIIDGYTQRGARPNSKRSGSGLNAQLKIELDGSKAGEPFVPGLRIAASGSTVKGLVINRFSASGIELMASGGSVIAGNFTGTDVTGSVALGNWRGISIFSPNNHIGGKSRGDMNLISGNRGAGVWMEDAGATGNLVQGNLIGTAADGASPLGNAGNGVILTRGGDVTGASGNTIGGYGSVGNTIAFSGGPGVFVQHGSYRNSVLSNSIYANGTSQPPSTGLGIDLLDPFGVTPNDLGDSDTGPNDKQNSPVVTSVSDRLIEGTLNSTPNTTFTLQLFSNDECDPSGYGEGERLLGSEQVKTDGSGNASFSYRLRKRGRSKVGNHVTATATDPDGNTSEFSACVSSAATQVAQILFAGDSAGGLSTGVFTVNPDGTGLTHPYSSTTIGYQEVYPRWSPNRERITFTNRTGFTPPNPNELYMMHASGDTLVTLVSDTSSFIPRWSPNGSHLAFECGNGWDVIDICVIGNVAGPLASLNGIGNGTGKVYVTDFDVVEWGSGPCVFAWDPLNPDRIAVVRDSLWPVGGPAHSMIFTMLYDGSARQRLLHTGMLDAGSGPLVIDEGMDWSSDGQWLVFAAVDPQGQMNIYKIDRNGTNLTQLTATPDHDGRPVWSRNGAEILFGRSLESGGYCDYDGWIMNSDGSNAHQITAEHVCDWNLETLGADWSPDGQQIVLTGFDAPYGNLSIYVVPRTVTAATYFTQRMLIGRTGTVVGMREVTDIQPSWRP